MRNIILKPNGIAIVDDADFEIINNRRWYLSKQGYAIGGESSNGIKSFVKMHRLIMGINDANVKIDHIDGDKLNNQRINLRVASSAQNRHNSRKILNTKNNYKGVSYVKKLNLYQSRCRMNGNDFYLGLYKTEISAAYAYNKKSIELCIYTRINYLPFETSYLEKILKEELVTNKSDIQSIYKYIYFKKKEGRMNCGKWFIQFKHNGTRYYKGYFINEDDARLFLINNYKHLLNDAGICKV